MATHSSILAWEIPWTEESGRIWSMRLQRVGHDLEPEHAHTVCSRLATGNSKFLYWCLTKLAWHSLPTCKNLVFDTTSIVLALEALQIRTSALISFSNDFMAFSYCKSNK